MQTMSFRIVLISTLILAVFTQLGCRKMASQNPIDTFHDGRFPRQLESLRSQVREMTVQQREAILARVAQDQNNPNLLNVAVIDSGVDIAHPDLQAQLAYRVENGRILGAGFDLMGNAESGTHVFVNPNLFAFASEGLKNGKITGVNQAPLQFIKKMQDRLADLILSEMQKDPVLMASRFAKISRESLQFLQLAELAENSKDQLEYYQDFKDNNRLITDTTYNIRPEGVEGRSVYRLLDSEWRPLMGEIETEVIDFIYQVEHADRFFKIVKNAFETVEKEFQYTERVKRTIHFMKGGGESTDSADVKKELEVAFRFVQYGPDAFDPILKMKSYFSNIRQYSHMSLGVALSTYANDLEFDYKETLKRKDLEPEMRKIMNRGIDNLNFFRSMAKSIENLEKDPEAYKKFRSGLRKYVHRTQHPFLHKESNGNSHGTHVAATIAKQNPNIRIVPIRVTTSSVVASKDRFEKVLNQLSLDFDEWLKVPMVQELISEIKKEYTGIQISESTIKRVFKKYFKKNELNALFITEVLKAIEVVGSQNIKLANVSLGTNFEKDHKLKDRIDSFVVDLIAEFVRYRMGQTMLEKAPHTLFLIATGNDNAWFDGVTRSAFPVGIRSMRLQKISDEKGLPVSPNNKTNNVVGVASVNPTGSLTAFTNFSIQKDFPQIFSTGEEIMAAIPPKELKAVESRFEKYTLRIEVATATVKTIQLSEMIKNRDRYDNVARAEAELKDKALTASVETLAQMLHFNSPITRQAMSGTSMATPTVTGELADFTIKRAISTNQPVKTHFASRELSPEVLTRDLMAMAKTGPYSRYMVVEVRTLVDKIQKWPTSKGQIATDKAIKCLSVISKTP